jgi:hypothetical protein
MPGECFCSTASNYMSPPIPANFARNQFMQVVLAIIPEKRGIALSGSHFGRSGSEADAMRKLGCRLVGRRVCEQQALQPS